MSLQKMENTHQPILRDYAIIRLERDPEEPYAQQIQVMAQSRNIESITQGIFGPDPCVLINFFPAKPIQRNSIANGQLDQDLVNCSIQRSLTPGPVMIMSREFAITADGLQIIIPHDASADGLTYHIGVWQSLNMDRVDEPLRPPPPPPIG